MASKKNADNVEVYTVSTPESSPQKKAENQQKFWHVDKEMIRFKLHYFLFIGAFGICLPYITIFAQVRIGISNSALAAILTAQRCIFIFTKVAIGYIADYFNKLKATICILQLITIIFYLSLLVVPKIENEEEITTFHKVVSNGTYFELFNNSNIYVECEVIQNNNSESIEMVYQNHTINNEFHSTSLAHISNILKNCLGNNKMVSENTSNDFNELDLEKIMNAISLKPTSYSCKLCCKNTGECRTINFKNPKTRKMEISSESGHINNFQTYQFWLYAILSTIAMACSNGLFTLTDTACCETVQKTGAQFGRQRLWGAIGWGLMSPIGGLINDYTGDFAASWIMTAVMSFISLLNMTKLKMAKPQFSENLMKDVGAVLASKEFLVFTFCVLLNGVGTGIIWFYHVLFLTDIGGSRFLVGMVMFIQSFVGGIPFMFFSEWIIKKIGHYNCLILSLIAYCIRFFWYSRLYNPWLDLPAEIFHGFSYGLFYTNLASFAKLSAKPGTEATTQAILFTAHEGVGIGIGCIVAGVLFDVVGGRRTFLYMSIYSGCSIIVSIVLHFLVRQKGAITVTPATNT
ncbi:Major facilitator superfamily like protein [Argiope bruennichi]|uniref:Major facilitator superfamily like protein n=1 Tax=Argiope bruennichi TaxID=94029 RepID=A0A8T0E9H5_ARGBR|nr:Major facilitator superfamily like protein [Argiope bruennichi]